MINPNDVDLTSLIHMLRKNGDTATMIYADKEIGKDYAVIVCPKWVAERIHAALEGLGALTEAVSCKVVPLKNRN